MADHDPLGVAGGAGGVDEGTTVVGGLGLHHAVQFIVRNVRPQLHEVWPLHGRKVTS